MVKSLGNVTDLSWSGYVLLCLRIPTVVLPVGNKRIDCITPFENLKVNL